MFLYNYTVNLLLFQVTSARPTLSDEEIQGIRADLVNYTNLEPKLIQNIMDALKKYRSKPVNDLFLSKFIHQSKNSLKNIDCISRLSFSRWHYKVIHVQKRV